MNLHYVGTPEGLMEYLDHEVFLAEEQTITDKFEDLQTYKHMTT